MDNLSKIPEIEPLAVRIKAIGASALIYYAAFSLVTFSVFYRMTLFETFLGLPRAEAMQGFKYAAICLLLIKFCLQRPRIRDIILFIVLMALGFVSFRNCGEDFVFFIFLFALTSKDIKIKYVAVVSLCIIVPMYLMTIICAYAGVIPSRQLAGTTRETRTTMGFYHPNSLGLYAFMICFGLSVIRYGKNPLPQILVSALLAAWFYPICKSRTAVLAIVFLVFLVTISWLLHKRPTFLLILPSLLFIAVLAAPIVSMVFYDQSLEQFRIVNMLLSGRMRYIQEYYLRGFTLFGEPSIPSTVEIGGLPADMAIGHLLFYFGIIPTLVFIVLIILVLIKAFRERCFNAVMFGLTVFFFIGLSETYMIRFVLDYSLIGIGAVLYSTKLSDFGPSIDKIERRKKHDLPNAESEPSSTDKPTELAPATSQEAPPSPSTD